MIYAVHPVRDDLTPALVFGAIRYVNDRYIYGDEIGMSTNEMPVWFENNLVIAAEEFDPAQDSFLLVGDYLQMVTFAAMLAAKHATFQVLRYDRQQNGYFPIKIRSNPAGVKVVG